MFFGTSSAVDPSGIWRWDDDVLTIEYVGGEVSGTFKNEDVAEVEITSNSAANR
jgi:hypothetical protein